MCVCVCVPDTEPPCKRRVPCGMETPCKRRAARKRRANAARHGNAVQTPRGTDTPCKRRANAGCPTRICVCVCVCVCACGTEACSCTFHLYASCVFPVSFVVHPFYQPVFLEDVWLVDLHVDPKHIQTYARRAPGACTAFPWRTQDTRRCTPIQYNTMFATRHHLMLIQTNRR